MGLQGCAIIFDNPTKTYYPGQNVTGHAILNFNSPKIIKTIFVKFKGEACTHWTESQTSTDSNGNSTLSTVSYGATETYFYSTHILLKKRNGKVTLNEGRHSFPFSYTLPTKLPSSFESKYGYIRYTVKVILDRPWKFDQDIKAIFTVVALVDLNLYPKLKKPANYEFQKTFCCLCCTSGPLVIRINLPYTGFVPGQSIPFKIQCNNPSRVGVTNILLLLQETIIFYSSSAFHTKKKKYIIGQNATGPIQAGDDKIFHKNIIIPALPPSNLKDCSIIDLKYDIRIVCCVDGPHKGKQRIIPITIGTVPIIHQPDPQIDLPSSSTPSVPIEENLSPPPPYSALYPNIPPPSYEECIYMKTTSVKDETDTTYTVCDTYFAPRYPVFRYTSS